eukprot:2633138-Rhodomonas_salina.1
MDHRGQSFTPCRAPFLDIEDSKHVVRVFLELDRDTVQLLLLVVSYVSAEHRTANAQDGVEPGLLLALRVVRVLRGAGQRERWKPTRSSGSSQHRTLLTGALTPQFRYATWRGFSARQSREDTDLETRLSAVGAMRSGERRVVFTQIHPPLSLLHAPLVHQAPPPPVAISGIDRWWKRNIRNQQTSLSTFSEQCT